MKSGQRGMCMVEASCAEPQEKTSSEWSLIGSGGRRYRQNEVVVTLSAQRTGRL
ncbi:MAG: hypothetical protein HFG53_14755 [Lachnospiraceae bacterium]|nr:hypothetical protein [Lachnospiraceae bacterium]